MPLKFIHVFTLSMELLNSLSKNFFFMFVRLTNLTNYLIFTTYLLCYFELFNRKKVFICVVMINVHGFNNRFKPVQTSHGPHITPRIS